MHGLALIYILRDMPEVQAFKIVQQTLHHTSVQVVPGPGFGPKQVASIIAGFQRRLGPEVRVDVQTAQAISAEKSGKYRYVISHLQR
jgi:phenylacetate-CoA ligase